MQNSKHVIDGPCLGNQCLEDSALLDYMDYFLPKEVIDSAKSDLIELGHKVINEAMDYARDAERNPPQLEQFNSWGERIDKLHTTWGWKKQKDFSAEQGIVAFGYEDKYSNHRRLLQFIRIYLYCPSSGLFNCPLAMTDGAAYLLKNTLKNRGNALEPEVKEKLEKAFSHLTSRDPKEFWTSGQWMTEVRGGSDVSGASATFAVQEKGPHFKLYGDKWFSSATDANMSVTVGRITTNPDPRFEEAKKIPLSLFFLEMRRPDGSLNDIQIRKLKDKLGTKQLPTAELELRGTKALLISEPGKGIKGISDMLNVTRLYNSTAACGFARRMVALVRDYSSRRKAFGKYLSEQPMYAETLMRMEVTLRGSLIFTLSMANLFGALEEGVATEDQANIFRIMTPIVKMFTAKEALKIGSEGIECFGGQGYIEGTGIPGIVRDAQVLSIWEGTTIVLCHDFIRGLGFGKTDKLESFARWFRASIRKILESDSEIVNSPGVRESGHSIITSFNNIYADLHDIITEAKNFPKYERNLRTICFSLARVYVSTHLGLAAIHSGRTKDIYVFVQFTNRHGPYHRYLSTTTKTELDSKLMSQIAGDTDDKFRHNHWHKDVSPALQIRPKFQEGLDFIQNVAIYEAS